MANAIKERAGRVLKSLLPRNLDIDMHDHIKRAELNTHGARHETNHNLEYWCKKLVDDKLVPQVPIEWRENGKVRRFHGAVLEIGTFEGEGQVLDRGFRKRPVVVAEVHGRLVKLDKVYDMNDASQSAIRYVCEGAPQEIKGDKYMHLASYAYEAAGRALGKKGNPSPRPTPKIILPRETTA